MVRGEQSSPAPHANDVSARARSLTAARGLAVFVALLVLLASLSAEAKKKKGAKKHKPAATGSKSTKSDRGLPPPDESASDEEEEKPASKKAAPEADESEEKKAPPPAPEPEEEPAKKPAKAAKKAAPAEEGGAGGAVVPVALQLGLGGTALFRNLVWTQDGGALAPYSLTPGPEVSVWGEAYPAAFATDGFAANIGLFGRFNYGVGASSKLPDGTKLTTKYQDFLAGLKIRIPVGSFIPYVAAAYGLQTFKLDPPPMMMDRPNFTYGVIHLGGGARIYFTPQIDLDVSAGYLLVNIGKAAGEVGGPGYYPAATAYGVDAGLSLGFRLTGMIGLRAGFDLRQIGMSLHWKMNDPSIKAGGAVDRYIGLWGGLEVTFDGLGGGGGESEAPAPKKPAKAKKAPPSDSESEGSDSEKSEKSGKEEAPSDVE